jgi:hypothetical protein
MLKAKDVGLSKSWVVTKRQGAAYTGGPVALSADGSVAACMCSDRVALLDLGTGLVAKFFPPAVAVRTSPFESTNAGGGHSTPPPLAAPP